MSDKNNQPSTRNIIIAILSTIVLADFGLGLNTVVLPLYANSLGASIFTVGLIIASFGLARILINIPVSALSKKFKSQFMHIGILSIFIGAVGYLISTNYYQLFVFRFLEGFGSGIINTSSMIILTKHLYQNEKRARVLSAYMIARRLSMGSAPFLGALVAFYFSDKSAFLLYSIIMAIGLIVAYRNRRVLNFIQLAHDEETAYAGDNHSVIEIEDHEDVKIKIGGAGKPKKNALSSYLLTLKNMSFLALCFLTFSFFFSRIGSRRELVPLVGSVIMNINKADIGLLISISAVTGIILTYYSDRIIDFMGVKKSILTSFVITAAGFISFVIFKDIATFILSIILLSIGGGFSGPARNLYLMDNVERTNYDEAIGIYRTLSDFGFILGPFMAGAVFEYFNYLAAYSLMAVIIILATVLFWIFGKSSGSAPVR